MRIEIGYVVPDGAEIVDARGMRQAVGVCGSALRAALAAILLYVCALDWPAIVLRAEFEALPPVARSQIASAAAPAWLEASDPAGRALWQQAQHKGKAGTEFFAAHGKAMLQPHPFYEMAVRAFRAVGGSRNEIPAALGEWLRAHSAQIAGVLAAWLLFEFALVAARLRGGDWY